MVCYFPLEGYRARTLTKAGKRPITFDKSKAAPALVDAPVKLPCGQCIGCRLERSRQWALRCKHEASLHERNTFITLTYDDQYLPADWSLNLTHFQHFMKRLRKQYGSGIRFFHCGEYGDQFGRPHYHALIFNHDFEDKQQWSERNGEKLYTSQALADLWPLGFSSLGSLTFRSAAYVARYNLKKVTGETADQHYTWVDDYGEIHHRRPEYVTMSRRPGIGAGWYDKWSSDIFPRDYVINDGQKQSVPKYYDGQYEIYDRQDFRRIKFARIREAKKYESDNTPERLRTRLRVQEARMTKLPRNLK